LDGVRVYRFALTADEVVRLYLPEVGTLVDPSAQYELNENSGTIANDSSGQGHDGLITGGAAWTPGVFGSALSFDGINDLVEVPSNELFNFGSGTSFSIEAWVRPQNAYVATAQFVSKQASLSSPGFSLMQLNHPQSLFWVRLRDTDGDQTPWISNANGGYINDGNWHHLVMVINRSGGTLTLYTDGVASAPFALNGVGRNGIGDLTSTEPLTFGGPIYPYRGALDGVRVYRAALSALDVDRLYSGQR
jgi:hypothetical protein